MRSITNTRLAGTRLIAQRTCVACHQIRAKQELIRLVRTPEGSIEIDSSGKRKGRGAYLCPSRECWGIALKGNRLEHALRGGLTEDNRQQLMKYGQELLRGVTSGKDQPTR